MAQKTLSKGSTLRLEAILGHVAEIKETILGVDDKRVAELVRRVAIPVSRDGYPANSMPEHTAGGGTSDPTGSTASGRVDGDRQDSDGIGSSLKRLERVLAHAVKDLLDAVGTLDNIDRNVQKKKERPTSVPCSICLELPAEKSGWCMPDYNDWHKHGSPDRAIWEMFKRRDVDGDGALRVPACPPPGGDRAAIRGPWRVS